jgi:signal transduction histidine kinase
LSIGVLIVSLFKPARRNPRANVFAQFYLLLITFGVVGELVFVNKQIYLRAELLGLIAIALYAFSFTRNKLELTPRKPRNSSIQAARPDLSPALASTMLEIGLKTEQSSLLESLTHSLSLYLMADICGVTTRPSGGAYQMLRIFDLIREDYIESKDMPPNSVPGFVKADANDVPFIANRNGKGLEESAFLQSTAYNQAGNLLYYPVSSNQAVRNYGVFCATPYTQKAWGEQEIYKLKVLRPKLQQLLEYSESLAKGPKTSRSAQEGVSTLEASQTELQEQMQKTNALLATIRADKNHLLEERTQQVRLWSERQRNLEDQVEILNKRLSEQTSTMQGTQELEQEKNRLQDALTRNSTHLEQLKEALATANSALHAIASEDEAEKLLFHSTEANTIVNRNRTTPVSTRQRIEAEIRSNANLFARQGQTCVCTVQPIPDLDYSQTVRLSRILEQLQRNACSASPNYGQVKVDVLSGEPEGKLETIEICITDYGGGLSPTDLQHFLKYISCNTSPVPVGIGDAGALREALNLVKSSGGHLWVNNPDPNATAYRILLPVTAESEWKLEKEG